MNLASNDNSFWMVYVSGTAGCSKQHSNYADAVKEAERLSGINPGRKVWVLESVGSAENHPVYTPINGVKDGYGRG